MMAKGIPSAATVAARRQKMLLDVKLELMIASIKEQTRVEGKTGIMAEIPKFTLKNIIAVMEECREVLGERKEET